MAEDSIRVYLSKEKKVRFKAACVLQDRDMSDVVNELIDQWLEQNETPPQQQKNRWVGSQRVLVVLPEESKAECGLSLFLSLAMYTPLLATICLSTFC